MSQRLRKRGKHTGPSTATRKKKILACWMRGQKKGYGNDHPIHKFQFTGQIPTPLQMQHRHNFSERNQFFTCAACGTQIAKAIPMEFDNVRGKYVDTVKTD